MVNNINLFATHLERSDNGRQKLNNEIIAHVEHIIKNYEANSHIPRHSTPLTEEEPYMKESITPFLGENAISAKYIPKLEEWTQLSGEGEYSYTELNIAIEMLKENLYIPNGITVGKLHSLFTRIAKKWYEKKTQDNGKHDWLWWKSGIITKWANNSWIFKTENHFQSALFNSEKDKPLTFFLKEKDRLSYLHPDMSGSMINMKMLRKCGGELEHAIR
ncbi:hypothetical protein O181_068686 [Austropuccinia psidii MF-1]|uniref:Uncharacterized protein n=1 Tax=Austropuccinia psidii MF-1 TaxID=1389203 RepID=A0A9Q3I451_9BASI|nr:hypothetical protein [Austropuccinia psidii MF-1]